MPAPGYQCPRGSSVKSRKRRPFSAEMCSGVSLALALSQEHGALGQKRPDRLVLAVFVVGPAPTARDG